jgi:hypothetical protein
MFNTCPFLRDQERKLAIIDSRQMESVEQPAACLFSLNLTALIKPASGVSILIGEVDYTEFSLHPK